MKKSAFLFNLTICACLVVTNLYAQKNEAMPDSLLQKIHFYGLKKRSSVLFAHFDKTVYVNNENVWFTAYLLNYEKKANNPSILSVLLVNDHDRSIALQQQFVMANGLAFGNVFIPDSIPPGDFSFIIYTNELLNGKPRDLFTQPIKIKATLKPTVVASLNIVDSVNNTTKYTKVQLKTKTQDGRPVPDVEVTYYLGGVQNPIVSGKVKTDQEGQYLFSVAKDQITSDNNFFDTQIKYNKQTENLRLILPLKENSIKINFYPEGGNLVHGTQSIIGWEVKNSYGKPLAVKCILFKDKTPTDTLYTDNYGMGKFKLIPFAGSKYEVRIVGDSKNTTYLLPTVFIKGPVISIINAVANDSLRLKVVSKFPGRFFLMVHNNHQNFLTFPVESSASGKTVLIILDDIPRGLNTITLLDSAGKPCAERIFFAHYNMSPLLNIITDRETYSNRQKVTVKLKLNTTLPDSATGIVSVACVENARIEADKFNDIESYFYLKHELTSIPYQTNIGEKLEEKLLLENVLLIKGWRRYTGEEIPQTKIKDTITQSNIVNSFIGSVANGNKLPKRLVSLMVMKDSSTDVVTTDERGRFSLEEKMLVTEEGKKVHLLSNDNRYAVAIKNPFTSINNLFAASVQLPIYNQPNMGEVNSNLRVLPGLTHTFTLREVAIRDNSARRREDGSLYSANGPNECGDYICYQNVINCPIHENETKRPAVKGGVYGILTDHQGRPVSPPVINGVINRESSFTNTHNDKYDVIVYEGCKIPESRVNEILLDGICISKQFYVEDYSQYSPPEPEYLSTIYWKHLCFVNSKKVVSFSFYTSDITGPFKIVVQGITQNDVIYGEKQIDVKK